MEIEGQLSKTKLHDCKQSSEDIIGSIRINPKSYTDAFINNPEGGPDIYIEGPESRRAAMEGDIVRVRLNHFTKWKLNRDIIVDRWDDWSEHLLPIIRKIEDSKKALNSSGQDEPKGSKASESLSSTNQTVNVASSLIREKRSAPLSMKKDDGKKNNNQVSKLPSNLPAGISRLEVTHVINLPFSSCCIQKTGIVDEIIKKNHMGIAGGFLRYHSPKFAIFSPTDPRVPRMLINIRECPIDFAVQTERYKSVLFVAQINSWDGAENFAVGSLIRIVGDCDSIQSRMDALLLEHQIYDEDFPPDAHTELDYLNNLPKNWFDQNSKGRRDLTDECVFTIDPKTARDLDDAVSIKQVAEQIYEVGVHIADVSFFVKELSAVDYYARLRTTSVYLVNRVIPMLPRILCERMCSLNPGEQKLTFSVIWKMDKYGRIIDEWFGRTIIKSCVKLAYEQAQDLIDKPLDLKWIKDGINMPKLHAFDWKRISKAVIQLNKIAQNLRTKRFETGALKIEQVKLKYELDSSTGLPIGFSFEERTAANFLIEEFMLLANMAVAKRIYQHSKDRAFLRRHPHSSSQLLGRVKEFCDAKNCPLDISSSESLQKSLNAITDPLMSKVVRFLVLRAMKNAEYICVGSLPDNEDTHHFALNVQFYTHFTSPIRRYPDLIVHRMLSIALGYESDSHEDVQSLTLMADECTKRKVSSKVVSDFSQKLYFNIFVKKAGHCELLACVTRIYDHSFDVILVDYDRTGRVYLDKTQSRQLDNFKFESFSGIKRLVINWKPSTTQNTIKTTKQGKKKKKAERSSSRSNLETSKIIYSDNGLRINESVNFKQVIQVFDVIKVIVTTDEKDITQLKINLKTPDQ